MKKISKNKAYKALLLFFFLNGVSLKANSLFSVFSDLKAGYNAVFQRSAEVDLREFLKQLKQDAQARADTDPKALTVLTVGQSLILGGVAASVGGTYGALVKSYSGILACLIGRAASAFILTPGGAVLFVAGSLIAFNSKELATLLDDPRYEEVRKKLFNTK